MAKVDLTKVSGGYYTQKQLNANFDKLRVAINNALFRNGTIPNQMEADLDMNSNNILNVNELSVDSLIIGGSATLPVLVSRSVEIQNPGAGILELTTNPYYVGNGSLTIHVDGLKVSNGIEYNEQGDTNSVSTSVIFVSPFAGTETVEIIVDATYQKGECSANPAIVNWISLADYICAGDDPDTALASALSDACTYSRAVYIPAGTWDFTAAGTATNCNISIFGDGPALTILRFNGTNGFQLNYTTSDHFRAYFANMSILQEQESSSSAIILSNTSGSTGEGYHTIFSNLDFMYRNPTAGNFTNHCWAAGIDINGVSEGTVENCVYLANNDGIYDNSFIKFNESESSFRWSITGNTIGYVNYGIWFKTSPTVFHEGIIVSDNDFANLDYAVYHDYVSGDLNVQHVDINNNYMFCAKDGIRISALLPNVHDNIIVHQQAVHSSTNGQYSCIYLFGECINGTIHDNQLGSDNTGGYTANGITINGTEAASIKYLDIHKNVINYAYTGILVQNNVEHCNWDDQMFGEDVTTLVSDTTASSKRNYHQNGASTHYRSDDVVDITTAVSIPTAYQVPFTYFDNNKDELDLTPVPASTITIPEHINKVRVTAYHIIRSDAVPTPGTTVNINIVGTNVDGNPLPTIIGAMELPAPGNGDYQTLVAAAAVVNVVAGSTLYVRVWSSAALAKSTIRSDLFIENVT